MQILNCSFSTERLTVVPLNDEVDIHWLADKTIDILSPKVTQALPPGWQEINNREKALEWIKERSAESICLLVKSTSESNVLGFIFLYVDNTKKEGGVAIRFGYLLSEEYWGKGIGTELMQGFVKWAEETSEVASISGGVEKSNIGSIKVLEKVGFTRMNEETEDTVFYQYTFG